MQGSANLNVMMKTARRAARGLVKDFREVENLQVSSKGAADFVSRADIAAEDVVREMLSEARPNYGWVGEESDPVEGKDPTRRWIVDPLDGTTNFLHGLAHWAVSIALEFKGEIVAGVVYDPSKDEMFFAEKGQGAWMNDQRLRVSGRAKMTECLFATGIPAGGQPGMAEALHEISRISAISSGVRRWGAASLDLAYVAAGRLDGYWEPATRIWDVAAGELIVREAGGMVAPYQKGGSPLDGPVIAANGDIFDTFVREVRGG